MQLVEADERLNPSLIAAFTSRTASPAPSTRSHLPRRR